MGRMKIMGCLATLAIVVSAATNTLQGVDDKPKASSKAKGTPSKLGAVTVGSKAHDICLAGNRGYVATDAGLTILDISNPASPTKLGSAAIPGLNQGVVVKGKHAYLANADKGLTVVDISNETAPKVVTSSPIFKCWAVAVKDNAVYALALKGTLFVFDISDPAAPKKVLSFGLPHIPKAAIGTATKKQLDALKANKGKGGQYKSGVSVSGNKMVAVDWNYGRTYLYDVTTATKPVFQGTHYAPFLLQARIQGDWIYALGAYRSMSGIRSVKMSEQSPDKPTSYLQCPTCGFAPSQGSVDQGGMGVSQSGKHLFWYGGKDGQFFVLDISSPGKMNVVASDRIPGHGVDLTGILGVASQGDNIFVCAGANGVVVYRFPGL